MTDSESYFTRARDWAVDTRARDARLLRTAWLVAGIAVSVALFEAVALAFLTPLKTVQPITILVDRQTGFTETIDPQKARQISADAALTRSLLAQYVMAREGFDRATITTDYRKVALWSGGQARRRYLDLMSAGSAENPLQRFPSGTVVDTRIKSVSSLSPGIALVRFDTQIQDRTGHTSAPQPWISIVRFKFVNAPMTFQDRLVNPLGLQVTGYRRDAEAPPAASDPDTRAFTDAPGARVSNVSPPVVGQRLPPRTGSTVSPAPTATPAALLRRGIAVSQIPLGSPLQPDGPASGMGRAS